MTQQIMLKKYEQKTNQTHMVEYEVKNLLSIVTAIDMIGLNMDLQRWKLAWRIQMIILNKIRGGAINE